VPQQHVVDIALLGAVARRVFPGARSVSVEPASPGRLLVVYRVRVDGVSYYLRVAEEAGEDLTTDAQVLARLAGLGVRVPVVVHVEAGPGDLDRSFLAPRSLPAGHRTRPLTRGWQQS
jgi:aminoglycoside phosphotransferase (APT) family kinase protein